jgi:hypothetical protein
VSVAAALQDAAAPATLEPSWAAEVRLRTLRRLVWCREAEFSLVPSHELVRDEAEFLATDLEARRLGGELDELRPDPYWERLCSELGLVDKERALLALTLAAELEPTLRTAYGYALNARAPLDATAELVAALWGLDSPPRFGHDGPLVRWALARPAAGSDPLSSTTGWTADPLLLDFLVGRPVLGPLAAWVSPPPALCLHEERVDEVVGFVESAIGFGEIALELELDAPTGSGRSAFAAEVAARLGQGLVAIDTVAVAGAADPAAAAARELRTARLTGALVLWEHAEALTPLLLAISRRSMPVAFLAAERRLPAEPGAVRRAYELPPPTRAERIRLWGAASGFPTPEPVVEWALRPAEIETAARIAAAGGDAIRDVCRRMLLDEANELLQPLGRPYTWDDLVVSPQLEGHIREFEAQARARGEVLDDWGLARLTPLGRGVTALFAGPSGTGKTMAAQVVARSLGLDLFRVDLAGVVNKYIGETEKHLRAVFAACERAPVLLFFDEADALFGRRMQVNDAHDRFANIEVDYLLQRMEQFDGIAVLATNRKGDLDQAFMRRLRFTIDFAPPTVAERERLWRLALEGSIGADGRPLVGDVDWASLARDVDLTGAGIKAAALAAAFLARTEQTAIEVRHLLAAARRELAKDGVVVRAGRLEAQ